MRFKRNIYKKERIKLCVIVGNATCSTHGDRLASPDGRLARTVSHWWDATKKNGNKMAVMSSKTTTVTCLTRQREAHTEIPQCPIIYLFILQPLWAIEAVKGSNIIVTCLFLTITLIRLKDTIWLWFNPVVL